MEAPFLAVAVGNRDSGTAAFIRRPSALLLFTACTHCFDFKKLNGGNVRKSGDGYF